MFIFATGVYVFATFQAPGESKVISTWALRKTRQKIGKKVQTRRMLLTTRLILESVQMSIFLH